ncbi:hypothetical protein [Clostridium botulinum]|uniref:hypothetical protein n=1 Tax=Clostridium botulinum TaxID=1491 RepID=UPI003DA34AF2
MKPSSFNPIPVKELTEQVSHDFQTTIQYQFDCLARSKKGHDSHTKQLPPYCRKKNP